MPQHLRKIYFKCSHEFMVGLWHLSLNVFNTLREIDSVIGVITLAKGSEWSRLEPEIVPVVLHALPDCHCRLRINVFQNF